MIDGKLTGEEIMDEAVKEPTLDRLLDKDPKEVDYKQLIKTLRHDRAAFITAQQAKRDPKMPQQKDEEEGE